MRQHKLPVRRCNAQRLEDAGYKRLLEAVFAEAIQRITAQTPITPFTSVSNDLGMYIWHHVEGNHQRWN